MKSGCILGLDSWADAGFSRKHGSVDDFVEGNSSNVTVFTFTLGSIDNLPIDHVFFAFNK